LCIKRCCAIDPIRLARVLKALADEKRLRIIRLLGVRSLCVCELEALVELTQPAVSHHLKILREAGLVHDYRLGKWIFYSLHEDNYNKMREALTALPTPTTGERSLVGGIGFCQTGEQVKITTQAHS
jgi:ArsR family transcriptional regulator, arsenate/arsenite/antimonite-responsive transcriptional repressor